MDDEASDASSNEQTPKLHVCLYNLSLQYVTDNLETGTVILGYIAMKSTCALDVTNAIIDAMQQEAPHIQIDFNIVVGQTYDGAANMQGHKSGVQKHIRSNYCFFAIPNHCWNHQIQLAVKQETSGHVLISNTLSYCSIIVKLYKYSPQRSEILKHIKIELKNEHRSSEFTTTVGKVLGLCVTQWTCHAHSLKCMKNGYVVQLIGFAKIIVTKVLQQKLKTDHKAEIIGMISKKQTFEF